MKPNFKKGMGKGKRSGKHVSEVQGNDLEEPNAEENCGVVQADMNEGFLLCLGCRKYIENR